MNKKGDSTNKTMTRDGHFKDKVNNIKIKILKEDQKTKNQSIRQKK